MVLEALVNPFKAEAHPASMLLPGFIASLIGIILGIWIFESHASLIMVFLTTMAAMPIVYNIIKMEEKKDLTDIEEKTLLAEHSRALWVFMYYFIGATLGFAVGNLVVPYVFPGINAFSVQEQTILNLRSNVTGAVSSLAAFNHILSNNLKVLIFCILFSFVYGLGALFILTWNASVIGVAIAEVFRDRISDINQGLGIVNALHYSGAVGYSILRFAVHGLPEILAYFVAGLAGGIISVAAIRHDFGTKKYEKIILDSSALLLLSILILVIAAFLEVYITPLIFQYT